MKQIFDLFAGVILLALLVIPMLLIAIGIRLTSKGPSLYWSDRVGIDNEIFKMPIAITRFSNIYGPGQLNFSALIPDSITSALGFSKFIPRGDGSMIRDFLYVGDVVDLYLRIGESMAISPEKISGEVFNAGTNKPTSVRDILEVVYKLAGNKSDFEEILNLMNKKQTVGEIQCQYMNYDKVNEYFKWSPTHSLQDGLIKSIEWYKRWNKK